MKFKIGQVIEHKVTKNKYIVIKYSYLNAFRNYPKIVLSGDFYGYETGYESEFQELKEEKQ